MDSQINTGGGTAIQGNANVGRDFVGRDQINNIVIVGSLLHFAQAEGLFPKIQEVKDFNSLTEAIESALGTRLNSDLATATAFAGSILGNFIVSQLPSNPYKTVPLKKFTSDLLNHIGKSLKKTGHWDSYAYRYNGIRLEATQMLWEKQYPGNTAFWPVYIKNLTKWTNDKSISTYVLSRQTGDDGDDLSSFGPKELRVVIAGLVLDLIRIGSDSMVTTEFLKEIISVLPVP